MGKDKKEGLEGRKYQERYGVPRSWAMQESERAARALLRRITEQECEVISGGCDGCVLFRAEDGRGYVLFYDVVEKDSSWSHVAVTNVCVERRPAYDRDGEAVAAEYDGGCGCARGKRTELTLTFDEGHDWEGSFKLLAAYLHRNALLKLDGSEYKGDCAWSAANGLALAYAYAQGIAENHGLDLPDLDI